MGTALQTPPPETLGVSMGLFWGSLHHFKQSILSIQSVPSAPVPLWARSTLIPVDGY